MASLTQKSMVLCLFLSILGFGFGFLLINGEFQRFEHPTKGDGTLSFLVIGDWGRKGHFNQSRVARQVKILFSSPAFYIYVYVYVLP